MLDKTADRNRNTVRTWLTILQRLTEEVCDKKCNGTMAEHEEALRKYKEIRGHAEQAIFAFMERTRSPCRTPS